MDLLAPIIPANGAVWKKFDAPRPYSTCSGIAFDAEGRFPILYRSDKVRSAKNAWSIPSGLAEIGFTSQQQFAIELKEELGLDVLDVRNTRIHGLYENIACNRPNEDNWHWVISVLSVQVETLDTLINKEPHKHSEIRIVSVADFDPATLVWTPGLGEWMAEHWVDVRTHIFDTLKFGVPI
jgi:ADP-ribose pyrophosphatase YjhB (NUDIX family)